MTTWREYDLSPGAGAYEHDSSLQGVHSTSMWASHVDVCTHSCAHVLMRACSGHDALTGEYLLEPSWTEWGDPPEDPVPPDDLMHLLLHLGASTVAAATRVGCELARKIAPTGASSTMVVSTAGDWSATIGIRSLREPRGFRRTRW